LQTHSNWVHTPPLRTHAAPALASRRMRNCWGRSRRGVERHSPPGCSCPWRLSQDSTCSSVFGVSNGCCACWPALSCAGSLQGAVPAGCAQGCVPS